MRSLRPSPLSDIRAQSSFRSPQAGARRTPSVLPTPARRPEGLVCHPGIRRLPAGRRPRRRRLRCRARSTAECDARVLLPGYPAAVWLRKANRDRRTSSRRRRDPPLFDRQALAARRARLSRALLRALRTAGHRPIATRRATSSPTTTCASRGSVLAAAEIAERSAIRGWRPRNRPPQRLANRADAGYMHLARRATPTVLTIHNLAHQGQFEAWRLDRLAIPHYAFAIDGVEFYGRISFLKAGLNFADSRHHRQRDLRRARSRAPNSAAGSTG